MDWDRLNYVVKMAVRFLDNVIEANNYPLEIIKEMTMANRKIGLGVMGFADLLIRLGIAYNSAAGVSFAKKIMSYIQTTAREASMQLAAERGPFPNYPGSIYEKQGVLMRNATVTTIAPTGTISIIAGCSSGIEPLFALAFTRNVMDNDRLIEINPIFERIMAEHDLLSQELLELVATEGSISQIDQIPDHLRQILVTAHDIEPKWHIEMQAAFQEFTDNAVSKTVNFPQSATKEQIEEVYNLAYKLGCKGVTVYRSGSREGEVLTVGSNDPKNHSETNVSAKPRKRPRITKGQTERIRTGCGNLYVTINEDDEGICEVFSTIGKAGGCAAAFSEATARLISLALRSGIELQQVVRELKGIRCPHPIWQNGKLVQSCPDAIAMVLERYLNDKNNTDSINQNNQNDEEQIRFETCPDCGGQLKHESGCEVCVDCGFSRCG